MFKSNSTEEKAREVSFGNLNSMDEFKRTNPFTSPKRVEVPKLEEKIQSDIDKFKFILNLPE